MSGAVGRARHARTEAANCPFVQISPLQSEALPATARAIAMYLPQFHPIPENDRWWGTGFTEWTNVAKARRLFRGHAQPVLPGELGFYDLRLPETREAQARLAASAGIEGFGYWHYWFGNGQRLLERPFTEVLQEGEPDFPFCLAWANQSWTGVWHGAPGRILIEQQYPGTTDDTEHFLTVLPALLDRRYIRVDGKPLLYIQAPGDLPHPRVFTDLWRSLARDSGLPGIYFVGEHVRDATPQALGFDAWVRTVGEFFPHRLHPDGRLMARLRRGPRRGTFAETTSAYDRRGPVDHVEHPSILTGWDNTPRSSRRGVVLTDFSSASFARHCREVLASVATTVEEHRLVFVKSWNEWAEGNYLEPDWLHGRSRLDTLRRHLVIEEAGG